VIFLDHFVVAEALANAVQHARTTSNCAGSRPACASTFATTVSAARERTARRASAASPTASTCSAAS
jgi:hypothetical protein